ncbi:Smr/MutS family protein [Chloroflexota bacterium]
MGVLELPNRHNSFPTRFKDCLMQRKPTELDLHGLTVDEAILLVNQFLDKMFKKNERRVWIIHGKGTGTLRRSVRQHLTKHRLVRSCSTADGNHGGIGATQVEIID